MCRQDGGGGGNGGADAPPYSYRFFLQGARQLVVLNPTQSRGKPVLRGIVLPVDGQVGDCFHLSRVTLLEIKIE